ncbi:MAG: SulP family inorganic anion transporter [Propionibacteriaceae bacterium]
MSEDYRVLPPQQDTKERLLHSKDVLAHHLVSLKGLLPTPSDYRDLPRSWGKDLLGGITVGVVALPLALGFGVASGMGAAAGLVTAIVAGVIAAVFGGSHLQVSGPTGAMTVVLLPVIAHYGIKQVPLLAILAGILVVITGLTGLGRAIDIIPWPVVEGFTMGIGVIIGLQQLPLILGTPKGESESTLVSSYLTLLETDWSHAWQPLAIAAVAVLVHLIGYRFFPNWPLSLIAIVVATVAAELSGWNVARIGVLPTTLPMPEFPVVSFDSLRTLAAPAVAVATLAALESLLSARVADGLRPDLDKTNADRELFGQGLANVASGFFGGMPATGAIARTAVNVRSGAHTRMSAIVHSGFLLLVMLLLGPIVGRIPMASLGAVLIMTAMRMVSPKVIQTVFHTTRADRNTFLMTLAATVVLDLVTAVLLGVAMAAVMSIRHMATYSVVRRQHLPADTSDGKVDLAPDQEHLRDRIAIFRIDGALFYGNARRFVDEVCSVEDVTVVIVRFHRTQIIDASGGEALKEVMRTLQQREIELVIQGMTIAQQRTASTLGAMSDAQHYESLQEALDAACLLVKVLDDHRAVKLLPDAEPESDAEVGPSSRERMMNAVRRVGRTASMAPRGSRRSVSSRDRRR